MTKLLRMVVVGLVCSLAGDVFLMLPEERFVEGLVSFLLAHIAYVVAFFVAGTSATSAAIGVAIVAVARKLLIALWRYSTQGLVPAGARLRPCAT